MQSYLIGIDIGTGSTKVVGVSSTGEPLFTEQEFYKFPPLEKGHNEQDATVIWNAFVRCVQRSVQRMRQPPIAVALSSAMHSIMAVDEHGAPLTPLLTWADRRSADIADQLKSLEQAEDLYLQCGTPIHAMSPLSKLVWWRTYEPSLIQKAAKFIGIKEYIWHKLFGDFQIDYSLACATGLFQIEENAWYPPALEVAGIPAERLSQPVPTTFYRTDISSGRCRELQLNLSTPIVIGASDGCCANLGSSSLAPGTAAVTIGTSGAVRIASEQPIRVYKAQLFNYRLDEQHFITGGPVNNGGSAVKWAVEQFFKEGTADYDAVLNEIATLPPGSGGLIFLPYLLGERAPIWDSKSCGVFFGLTHEHTPLHLLKSVVEAVCYALNEVMQILEEKSGPLRTLHISGGFAQSYTCVQVLANITGKQICLMQNEDASSVGAAYLGLKALGIIKNYDELPKQQVVHTFSPQAEEVAIYRDYIPLYNSLYPVLKPSMHALFQLKTKQH